MVRRESRGSNKNQKPSSYESRKLKTWMLAEFGDGLTVTCFGTCGRRLLYSEITKDRYPIPGRKGGRYVKGNIRPMCMSCNAAEGAREAARERAEEKQRREARNARRREIYAQRRVAPATV
jgi:hypothetical protein